MLRIVIRDGAVAGVTLSNGEELAAPIVISTADPKRTVFRDAAKRSLTAGGLGSVGEKAATAIADFLVLDMFANYCTGREDAKGAIAVAERQAKRIYR